MTAKKETEGSPSQWSRVVEDVIRESGLPIVSDERVGGPVWVDVRELRLRYLVPVKRIQPFFDGLRRGRVMATRCPAKNIYYFPPQADCPTCLDENLEWVELKGEGELLTYTKIVNKPASFAHYSDYIVAIARMDEGFNVLCWLAGSLEEIKPGMRVKLVVKKREPEGFFSYYLEAA